jgi:hypothetical protein
MATAVDHTIILIRSARRDFGRVPMWSFISSDGIFSLVASLVAAKITHNQRNMPGRRNVNRAMVAELANRHQTILKEIVSSSVVEDEPASGMAPVLNLTVPMQA